jgi:hypothetical protein
MNMEYELTNTIHECGVSPGGHEARDGLIAGHGDRPNRKSRRAQAAKERRARTTVRVFSGPLGDDQLDPWARQIKALGFNNPLQVVRHSAGWVVVQCSGLSYQVCGGPFAIRTDAREVMDEWAAKERRARTTEGLRPAASVAGEALTPPGDNSLEPWGRRLEILCYDTPLDLVYHPVGWVIVQCSGSVYNVCDGPFATRMEARGAMEGWLELRRSMKIWKAELTPEKR